MAERFLHCGRNDIPFVPSWQASASEPWPSWRLWRLSHFRLPIVGCDVDVRHGPARELGPNRGGNHSLMRGLTRGRTFGFTRGPTHGRTRGLAHGPTSSPARIGLPLGQTVPARVVLRGFVHGAAFVGQSLALRGRDHRIIHGTAHLGQNPGLHGVHHGIMRVGGSDLPHDVGAVPRAVPTSTGHVHNCASPCYRVSSGRTEPPRYARRTSGRRLLLRQEHRLPANREVRHRRQWPIPR